MTQIKDIYQNWSSISTILPRKTKSFSPWDSKQRLGRKPEMTQKEELAMGTKMAFSFANIFMAEIESELLGQSRIKPLSWKRFIDDIFSLWDTNKQEIELFIEQANNFHPTIKFTAEFQTRKSHSPKNLSLISKHITSRLKPFNIPILPLVTHQVLKEVSSKVKLSDFSELTPQKQLSRSLSLNSKHVSQHVDTLNI